MSGARRAARARADALAWDGVWLDVTALDLEGQGVARTADGKVVFVEGALPGERVQIEVTREKAQWAAGTMRERANESVLRVVPRCPHFGLHAGACGGCKSQHLEASAQVAVKQRVLEDLLRQQARVRPEVVLRPLAGPTWGYRQRARLSVRHVAKKGTVLVGFHERKSRYVADMRECHVLPPHVGALLVPLRELVGAMDARDRLPQIELAVGDAPPGAPRDAAVTALVLRHLEPLSAADAARLRAFAARHRVQWWLQPGGPATVHRLDEHDGTGTLAYHLPAHGVVMPYRPTDFTQVNPAVNEALVGKALALLDAQPGERVVDWFCGLGNFTLPIARRVVPGGSVLGLEGSTELVARAMDNARLNGLAEATRFAARNLFDLTAADLLALGAADRWLIDPPREGAFALAKALVDLLVPWDTDAAAPLDAATTDAPSVAVDADPGADAEEAPPAATDGAAPAPVAPSAFASDADRRDAIAAARWTPPRRIVYVSCNPATLARDVGLLVHRAGYTLRAAGIANMFPHTAHVESVAVLERAADFANVAARGSDALG